MRRRLAPHFRDWREDYYILGIIFDLRDNPTTRQICERAGVDYRNNGNKREGKWYKKLEDWVYRGRETGVNRWAPRPEWKHLSSRKIKLEWLKKYPNARAKW